MIRSHITSLNTLYCGGEPDTLPHSPSDIEVVRAEGSHQDFRVCQNIAQSALELMHGYTAWTVDMLEQFALYYKMPSSQLTYFYSYVMVVVYKQTVIAYHEFHTA